MTAKVYKYSEEEEKEKKLLAFAAPIDNKGKDNNCKKYYPEE